MSIPTKRPAKRRPDQIAQDTFTSEGGHIAPDADIRGEALAQSALDDLNASKSDSHPSAPTADVLPRRRKGDPVPTP
jgi:hypothetical protein